MFQNQNSRPVLYLTVLLALVMSLCLNQTTVRASSLSQSGSSNSPTEPLDASTWQKVIAPDGTPKDGFGYSVAISDDGSTAAVGTYYTEFGSTFPIGPGAVYVFINDAGTWVLQQKLPTPSMPESDVFGFSVALSADGSTALVGAHGDFGPPDTEVPGAAYIFTRSEGVWSQQAMLTASDRQVGDHFGVVFVAQPLIRVIERVPVVLANRGGSFRDRRRGRGGCVAGGGCSAASEGEIFCGFAHDPTLVECPHGVFKLTATVSGARILLRR